MSSLYLCCYVHRQKNTHTYIERKERKGLGSEGKRGIKDRGQPKMYRFSKKVFALTMFLPMEVAFHGKYEPDGSTCRTREHGDDGSGSRYVR
jgi:hypothetical protein